MATYCHLAGQTIGSHYFKQLRCMHLKIVLQWEKRQCLRDDIQNLMNHHDYHHRSFKKLVAENKPFEYQMANSLLSFAGFLR